MPPHILKLRAYFAEYNADWKRCIFNFSDEATEDLLRGKNFGGTSPLRANGFYGKVCNKTVFLRRDMAMTSYDLLEKQVEIAASIKFYKNAERTGWYLELQSVVEIL